MPAPLDLSALAELCAEVIGVRSVAPEENFFDAGGDSVSAARLVVLLTQRWDASTDIFSVIAADNLIELYDGLQLGLAGELT